MSDPQKPLASQALLDYLDQVYPPLTASAFQKMCDRDVAHYMGQRAVVEKLRGDLKFYTSQEKD